ncbi:hypothetical protein [Massilia soli]|uniref:Uncharacterized protein n=1 Tax=Massilia soli TaxID=2792854 RepID=A0ABS7SVL5_9BURK|nr:hypothetical protein [Massilia soli]MBZ2209994.1 hypothetical protein [Massilia soli]
MENQFRPIVLKQSMKFDAAPQHQPPMHGAAAGGAIQYRGTREENRPGTVKFCHCLG